MTRCPTVRTRSCSRSSSSLLVPRRPAQRHLLYPATPTGYSRVIAEQQPDARGDYVDERGVLLTAAGRARMRAKLDELANRWTSEEREARCQAVLARILAA